MNTINISLSNDLKVFIDEQIAKGGHSTVSEYIRHLICQAQKQAATAQVEALLLEGLDSGEPIDVTDEWWEQKRAQMMERFHQHEG